MPLHSFSSLAYAFVNTSASIQPPALFGQAPIPAEYGSGSFAAELVRSLRRVSAMQNSAAAQARAFELGVPGVALNDVMVDMHTAGLAFNATLQVRNRLVAAYQEIASMPV